LKEKKIYRGWEQRDLKKRRKTPKKTPQGKQPSKRKNATSFSGNKKTVGNAPGAGHKSSQVNVGGKGKAITVKKRTHHRVGSILKRFNLQWGTGREQQTGLAIKDHPF